MFKRLDMKLIVMYRKTKKQEVNPLFYDSDAIYRDQSIYGGTPFPQQQGSYVSPTLQALSSPTSPDSLYAYSII